MKKYLRDLSMVCEQGVSQGPLQTLMSSRDSLHDRDGKSCLRWVQPVKSLSCLSGSLEGGLRKKRKALVSFWSLPFI